MAGIPCRDANDEDLGAAARVVHETEGQIQRRLDTTDLPELLYDNLEHPRWDDVAAAVFPAPTAPWSARPAFVTQSKMFPTWAVRRASGFACGIRASTLSMPTPQAGT